MDDNDDCGKDDTDGAELWSAKDEDVALLFRFRIVHDDDDDDDEREGNASIGSTSSGSS